MFVGSVVENLWLGDFDVSDVVLWVVLCWVCLGDWVGNNGGL